MHDCTEQDFDGFNPLKDQYQDSYDVMTTNNRALSCLNWSNPELALRSKGLQNLEFMYVKCHELPKLYGIDSWS